MLVQVVLAQVVFGLSSADLSSVVFGLSSIALSVVGQGVLAK